MKLRIKGNSLRIRLSKTEVSLLSSGTTLEDSTSFGPSRFVYLVQPVEKGDTLSASYEEGVITLYVPQSLLQDWPHNQVVGFDARMPVSDSAELYLLLEKDFKCLDTEVAEDQSDFYENPDKSC